MHLSQEVILKVRSKKLEDFQPHFSLIIQPVLFIHQTLTLVHHAELMRQEL